MYHLPMTHLPYIIYPSSLIKVTRLPYIQNITLYNLPYKRSTFTKFKFNGKFEYLYNENIFSIVSIILHWFCKILYVTFDDVYIKDASAQTLWAGISFTNMIKSRISCSVFLVEGPCVPRNCSIRMVFLQIKK